MLEMANELRPSPAIEPGDNEHWLVLHLHQGNMTMSAYIGSGDQVNQWTRSLPGVLVMVDNITGIRSRIQNTVMGQSRGLVM